MPIHRQPFNRATIGKLFLWLFLMSLLLLRLLNQASAAPQAVDLRISQIYGGGGNSAATYQCDFVELLNAGTSVISLNGHSIQYAASSGNFSASNTFALPDGSLNAGQYYLIQLGCGDGGNGEALPTPDATGTIKMSGTNGKVAFVSNTEPITGSSDPDVVDFVGYGSANDSETSPAQSLSDDNDNSLMRVNNGCTDRDNNSNDFGKVDVSPRHTSSATNSCPCTALTVWLNEFHYDDANSPDVGEFIEVVQPERI